MSKQDARINEDRSNRMGWQSVWIAAAYVLMAAALSVFAWYGIVWINQSDSYRMILITPITAIFLVVSVERSLAAFSVMRKRRYRLAFYYSAGLFFLLGIYRFAQVAHANQIIFIFMAWMGAFIGGLFVTALNEKLWEDNSPPAEAIQAEVYQRHVEIIGVPGKGSPAKRVFDASLAVVGLIVSMPIWLLSALLLWLEDPGPILFVKNSVGKGGPNFHQYKFRTMVSGAEERTGPILASERDERVLTIGRFLRKTALDELPQLINILIGEMSFVGPRPQRTVLVRDYLEYMPEYAERHLVLPGLSGLAQVAGDYYLTPRQKLRFDRLYIRHSSLGFDMQLILLAFLIAFWFRWQREWNGRLPRWMLRFGSPKGQS